MIKITILIRETGPSRTEIHCGGQGDGTPEEIALATKIRDAIGETMRGVAKEGAEVFAVQRDGPRPPTAKKAR